MDASMTADKFLNAIVQGYKNLLGSSISVDMILRDSDQVEIEDPTVTAP